MVVSRCENVWVNRGQGRFCQVDKVVCHGFWQEKAYFAEGCDRIHTARKIFLYDEVIRMHVQSCTMGHQEENVDIFQLGEQ